MTHHWLLKLQNYAEQHHVQMIIQATNQVNKPPKRIDADLASNAVDSVSTVPLSVSTVPLIIPFLSEGGRNRGMNHHRDVTPCQKNLFDDTGT